MEPWCCIGVVWNLGVILTSKVLGVVWNLGVVLKSKVGIHTEGGEPCDIHPQTLDLPPPQTPEEIFEISSDFNLVLCLSSITFS